MVRRILMSLLPIVLLATPALAGPLFKRPNKPDPAEHVPALIKTLQSDPDERKRESAAEELREYDLKSFPDIVPALVEALKNDPSSAVRLEVVSSISKMRPITQPAGYALEQAVADDTSFRVRTSAKSTLVEWVLVRGYVRQYRPPATSGSETEEPPLAGPSAVKPPVGRQPAPKANAEPILPPLMPTQSPSVQATPASNTKPSRSFFPLFSRSGSSNKPDEGPVLNPPK